MCLEEQVGPTAPGPSANVDSSPLPGLGSHLNLLAASDLDKLVHSLAQVPQEGVGAQAAPHLLFLPELHLQHSEPVQQLVQGQLRAGDLEGEV